MAQEGKVLDFLGWGRISAGPLIGFQDELVCVLRRSCHVCHACHACRPIAVIVIVIVMATVLVILVVIV